MPALQPEIVCAVPGCGQSTAATLCEHHQRIFDRAVPDRLEKRDTDEITAEELAVIRARLRLDAGPLFLVALAFCVNQSIRKGF